MNLFIVHYEKFNYYTCMYILYYYLYIYIYIYFFFFFFLCRCGISIRTRAGIWHRYAHIRSCNIVVTS